MVFACLAISALCLSAFFVCFWGLCIYRHGVMQSIFYSLFICFCNAWKHLFHTDSVALFLSYWLVLSFSFHTLTLSAVYYHSARTCHVHFLHLVYAQVVC